MSVTGHPLEALNSLDEYRRSFLSPTLWQPYVQEVCRAQGWSCREVRAGLAGTFPAFIVDGQRVAKFFGPLFDGEMCWRVELESAQLIQNLPQLPAARLLHSGVLEGEPAWHYLVFEMVPGMSIGMVYEEVPFENKQSLARWLGGWLPSMHRLKVGENSSLPQLSAERMHSWFAARWQEESQRWPTVLAVQVEGYLSANASSLQAGDETFIHADISQDHILGELGKGGWTTRAVIDFGDAMRGNLYYELVALHLDLFDCDKRLLAAFLQAYGLQPDPDFVRKAMVTSLLHQFDVYAHLFNWKPELKKIGSLEELADRLWKLEI